MIEEKARVPEDKRVEPVAEAKTAAEASASEAADDLEALAGALPQPQASDAPQDPGDDADLGTLSKVAGSRLGAPAVVAATPAVVTSDAQAPGPAPGARWVAPLLFGVGAGIGLAVTLFALGVFRTPQASAPASAAAAQAPPLSPALPDAPAPPAAAPPAIETSPAAPVEQSAAAGPARAVERIAVGTAPAVPAAKLPSPADPAHPTSTTSAPIARAAPPTATVQPTPAIPAETGQPADEAVDKEGPVPSTLAKAAAPETVDKLLDEALSPTARREELERKREAALAAAELPLAPSRDDLTQAMTVILPAIRGCAMGQTGLATAAIVLRSDGRVVGVEVTGAPFVGAPSGHCMEGVIRRAHFPRFKQPTFRIKFPLAIQ